MQLSYSVRALQIIAVVGVAGILLWFFAPHNLEVPLETLSTHNVAKGGSHPIDKFIQNAEIERDKLLEKETTTLVAAADAYRRRRGRHPPPLFDQWFRFAQNKKALLVEDFFDPIYDDLGPFWAYPPDKLRWQAGTFGQRISVKDGNTSITTDIERPWMNIWSDFISTIAEHLPDMEIAINVMDEPRIVVPWEDINKYKQIEESKKKLVFKSKVIEDYATQWVSDLHDTDYKPKWIKEGPLWTLVRQGCHPDSPARQLRFTKNVTEILPLPPSHPPFSRSGYVGNWTTAKSLCIRSEFQTLHGTFIEPLSMATTQELFPMFGGSKLSVNNEILLPPAMYWSDFELYSGGPQHGLPWDEKQDKVMWRGAASGGRNKKENWIHFQRHRFVSMLNGTTVSQAENGGEAPNFKIPIRSQYKVEAQKRGLLGEWLSRISDVAFMDLLCFPREKEGCSYVNAYYSKQPQMPMADQYDNKYLPDIDGNSFSGRYRGFLKSTSLPIKATIYNEWHDSRLIPWQHFVPMDNTFADIYGILDYFMGYEGKGGHDDMARLIAENGKAWAERVLRKEDMQIYVYRLLLEYARVCDDQRERLGYIGDL